MWESHKKLTSGEPAAMELEQSEGQSWCDLGDLWLGLFAFFLKEKYFNVAVRWVVKLDEGYSTGEMENWS